MSGSLGRRYAVSGRDHTGKTTICHAVTARLRVQGIDAQMVDEQSRRSVALAEGRREVATQLDLFARTLVVELEVSRSTEVVVCDRSLVDILAYTDLLPSSADPAEKAMCAAMDAFAEHYLATYAAIFLTSFQLDAAAGTDPLRAPVRHLQDDLEAHIERRLAPYADRVVRLIDPTTAVDDVVAHIRSGRGHLYKVACGCARSQHVRVHAPTRRTLLGAGLAGVAAAGLTACESEGPSADPTATPTPSGAAADGPSPTAIGTPATTLTVPDFDAGDWDSVRAQFPLDAAMSQFAAFVLSPHTAQVDAAVDHHRRRLAFDTERALLDGDQLEQGIQQAAADYAGGAPGQYALTDSTTMGIASMYGGLSLQPGDEVLTTTHDFYSTEESLRLLEHRTGATVRRVTLYDEPWRATVDEMVSRLSDGLTPRTKVVAVTWVHSSTGVRLPVREISRAVDGRALLCVDGVHGFGVVDVDLPDLGCDFLSAGTHKWLFGPRGTGILWGKNFGPLTELIPSFSGFENGARLSPGGYHSFEHRWALDQAFAFHQRIGRASVVQRTVEQATRLKEGVTAAVGTDKVRVVTPLDPEVSAGIVCFDVAGLPPGNGVLSLREQGIVASATPYQQSYLRLGPSIVTTPEQVDTAVQAVAGLGA